MNTHVKNYLDKYLEVKNPDFAVLLKGEWGSGKTYFIKEYISTIDVRKRKCRYVSLNGISSFDEIVVSLFLKEEWKKSILKYAKRIFDALSLGFSVVGFSLGNILKAEDFKNTLKDKVLIFDDFERCKIPLCELCGFISGFVELNHLHVIIIADESKIGEKDEYWSRKEKIVGATLELEYSMSETIPKIIAQVQYDVLKKLLLRHKERVLELYTSILKYCGKEQINYRVFKHAVREFEFVFRPIFDDKTLEKYKDRIFKEIFFRYLSAFYCLQVGKIEEKSLRELLEFHYVSNKEENTESSKFQGYFPQWGSYDSFLPLEVWLDIFSCKKINLPRVLSHIQRRFSPQIPAWEKLWHYLDYTDSEISSIYDEVEQALAKKEYRTVVSILHTFTTLLELADLGFIDKTCKDISLSAQKYLNELEDDIEWHDSKGSINQIFDYLGGYGLRGKEIPQFKEITACLKEKLERKVRLNLIQRYEEFIGLIGNDKFISMKLIDERYLYEDIFSGNDPNLLWNKVKELYPKAFGDFCRICIQTLIPRHLERTDISQGFKDYWLEILMLSQNFLDDHKKSKTERSKCYYLEKGFIPEMKKLCNRNISASTLERNRKKRRNEKVV